MKILFVINSLETGGAEKLLVDLIPEFSSKGMEVELLLLNGNESPFYKQLANTNSCKINSLGHGSVYNPLSIFKIIPFLKKHEIIHVHLFPALYWVAIAKLFVFSKRKPKLIFTEHNTTNKRRTNPMFKLVDKFMYGQFDEIITIAETVDKNLKKYLGPNNHKFSLIKNGINLQKIYEARPLEMETEDLGIDNRKILVQVSSFTKQKDQKTLIRAMIHLPKNMILWLVGDGEEKAECIKLVQKLKLNDRIRFLGIRMDIPMLLKTSDIVLLSSKFEGLSLSSVEGMASGKPFVASDVPGLTNVVYGAGILFPYGDEKKLAQIILKLLGDSELYNNTVVACLKRSKEYGINIMVDKHIQLYKSVLQ